MIFGPIPAARAEGAILAHSLRIGDLRLKKGARLTAADVAALRRAGGGEITVAFPEPGDVREDEAAAALAAALAQEAGPVSTSAAFTGRANLFAETTGLLRVDRAAIDAVNAVDEALTIATLPDYARAAPRQMLATVKIIPYAAPRDALEQAAALAAGALTLHPVIRRSASLLLTQTHGMKPSLLQKGEAAVAARLAALGVDLAETLRVEHDTAGVANALRRATGAMALILTGSATADRRDVGPAGLIAAGGDLIRFGMPVDPGNLLFLGRLHDRPVIGLPGCARSPQLNGADWVLERVACGLDPTAEEIAAMGVGGLLKEIAARPEPRAGGARAPARPKVVAALLAAGASRRMRGADKLLEDVDGAPLLRRAAQALTGSRADAALVVLPPDAPARADALNGLAVESVVNPAPQAGMASSIRAALAALPADADAVLLCLADMPEVAPDHLDRLIAAFSPEDGRAICRAVDAEGSPGHPVLFGRRFFEALARLEGDVGARALIAEHAEFVADVTLPGAAATTDLDTPEDWAGWRARR